MKISIIQHDIVRKDLKGNLDRAEQLILSAQKSDLYVLPEMFSTGFGMKPEKIAETSDGETLKWMHQMAKVTQAAIAGSVAIYENGKYYNRFYFIYPDGKEIHYDKRHLFSYAKENEHYTPGNERVVLEYKGVRILLQVCYDLRFPVFSRNCNDFDLMLYTANWPDVRLEAWDLLLKARAVENQCYVAAVNRCGSDPSGEYKGHSVILDPFGKTLAQCTPGENTSVALELDMEKLQQFRKDFPVLNDADDFELK